jgi:hypothetical protein
MLQDDAVTSAKIADNTIVNANINSSAAIAYSKLNLGTSITSSDLASTFITGATSESTIAGGDQILIYDDSAGALRKMTRTNFVSGVDGTNELSFFATNTAPQSIPNATTTKIILSTEIFDTDSAYDTSTSRFTVPAGKGGKYLFTAGLGYNASLAEMHIGIFINGSDTSGGVSLAFMNYGVQKAASYCKIYNLNAGDYIELYTNQTSGSSQDTTGAPMRNFLAGFRLVQ